ncbi:HNH endonuclease [Xenorhabdus bovienii]|uniref:HNH endonuclease n=1 Tax=Xenorhabdus bovienii TaxID=40576 RepID=UPI0023B2B54E|nr:HNH endonuclease [Xenorhabdus bovienii]MDE9553015.1 HNH endonuclease [Xenorhabdus bovienii]MDE9557169.1 HNH endonuclease [Xenorhabdus bovienii]
MDVCYFCGNKFNQSSTVDHGEHVIQQAIGGNLISKGILCKGCGGDLSREIDTPFNAIFEGIATRLDIKTDRKANKNPSIPGVIVSEKDAYDMNLKGTPVFWKNFKVTPVKPFHRFTEDKTKVIVYSSKKQFENHNKILEKEIKNMGLDTPPEIVMCDDIDGNVQYQFPMENIAFKRGIAKIAIGFAFTHGISREKLPLALKISNENRGLIDDKISLIRYAPLSIIDKIIEKDKADLANYPSHTLILFTSKQEPSLLLCYVELFSTFQFYILLNDRYEGEPVYKYHYQRIEKANEYVFTPDRRHYKDRNMILGRLGITNERIQSAYDKQKDKQNPKSLEEIEIDLIREETEKQKNKTDFESDIKNFVDYCGRKIILNEAIDFEMKMDFSRNLSLFSRNSADHPDEEIFDISSYRRFFIHKNKRVDYHLFLLMMQENNASELNKHSFYRFEQLEKYSQDKGIREKIRQAKIFIEKSKNETCSE